MAVRITVTCGECDQEIATFTDTIAEKYPFYCETCEDQTSGKHPWSLTTEVVPDAD